MFVISTVIITGGTKLSRELDVSFNDIGDSGISVITQWLLSKKALKKLSVSWCNLSGVGHMCECV